MGYKKFWGENVILGKKLLCQKCAVNNFERIL